LKKGLIVASFGTTHDDTREKTIDVIENDVKFTIQCSGELIKISYPMGQVEINTK